MTAFTIDIISDTVCPWCYIGHARLLKAIHLHSSRHPTDSFRTRWHAFQLNPQYPRGDSLSTPKREYYERKLGPGAAEAIFQRLNQAGRSEGINFSFGGRTGNTWDSHRLIALAGKSDGEQAGLGDGNPFGSESGGFKRGMQTRVVEELFRAYFEQEQDITSREVLTGAATRAGVEKNKVKSLLEGGGEGDVVATELANAAEKDVHSVPHFTINGLYEVEGGQEPADFVKLFERLKTSEGLVRKA